MKYRQLGELDLEISEVGFGVWSISTGWQDRMAEREASDLLVNAYDLGVNFFDTSDVYGDGYGEHILAKALGNHRHDVILASKVGYDMITNTLREQQTDRRQNFNPEFIRYACEQSLRRLKTDYVDLYQLHNPTMDTIESDSVFDALDILVQEGKIRHYGVTLGSEDGWLEEGEASVINRQIAALQIPYSILEQDPATRLFPIAVEGKAGLVTRDPHTSGMLEATYSNHTGLGPTEQGSYRTKEWLDKSFKKTKQIHFLLDAMDSTIGQIAIKFALSAPMVASALPNITNLPQLEEFASAPETIDLPKELLELVLELNEKDFGLEAVTE